MATDPYTIRLCRADELAKLSEIEQRAGQLFAATPYAFLCSAPTTPIESLRQQQERGTVWVAADQHDEPVGFALAGEVDGDGYLHELDVDPSHGRQGLGRRLVEAVCTWARNAGYASVTLSTFVDVAWNAPFYAKLGFVTLREDEMTTPLRELRQRDEAGGLPTAQRVFMQRNLANAGDNNF